MKQTKKVFHLFNENHTFFKKNDLFCSKIGITQYFKVH